MYGDERVGETFVYHYGAFKIANLQLHLEEKRKSMRDLMIFVCSELVLKVFDIANSAR